MRLRFVVVLGFLLATAVLAAPTVGAQDNEAAVLLGRRIFQDASLSLDRTVSCQTCHDPKHAYADAHPRSIGVGQKTGTRNAPSLVGVGHDDAFFWDGRRTNLGDAILDPFTNPVEFALPSMNVAIDRLEGEPDLIAAFKAAYPRAEHVPTPEQVELALSAFIRSLDSDARDDDPSRGHDQQQRAEQGKRLFEGVAGCGECHTVDRAANRYSDGRYHFSGVEQAAVSTKLPQVTRDVLSRHLDSATIGRTVLADPDWSALGHFVVTHDPADIGAFRTPSLRNVAVTAPYMHDGSIATLSEAVDHEIYYRGFSTGHPIDLSYSERRALVAFLESLTDFQFAQSIPDERSSTGRR